MAIPAQQIEAVRAFNRDYTRRIGVLAPKLYDSPWTLTQVRVMYEIAHRPGILAAQLSTELDLDRGYLSRILKAFIAQRLLQRTPSGADARRQHLRLTRAGSRAFAPLERSSQRQMGALLARLEPGRRELLLSAMRSIREVFSAPELPAALTLRAHRPGDMGWVVARHAELYAREFGWSGEFEGLVAGITADFIAHLDPARERCWIAERDGQRLGCIFLVKGRGGSARLRLLLVEPAARGLGLGAKLVEECLAFARAAGYRRVVLWTHANLRAARHLYRRAGFRLTGREPRHSFGKPVVSETWQLSFEERAVPATRRGTGAANR
jgi:DNA-binding MarR family transcriptional regulator/ribosomal protein S18 acetylase RimI-like enzyme